jgi:transcription elongation factor GreA-like protein
MNELLTVGVLVRHPAFSEWGVGQVQSVIGDRITVNFENVGKQVIDGARVTLELEAF